MKEEAEAAAAEEETLDPGGDDSLNPEGAETLDKVGTCEEEGSEEKDLCKEERRKRWKREEEELEEQYLKSTFCHVKSTF